MRKSVACVCRTWVGVICVSIGSALPLSAHSQGDDAEIFITTLMSICKLGAQRPEVLIRNLAKYPELPPEKAKAFLHGHEGHAWPISNHGVQGNLVMALTKEPQMCALFARRVDVQTTRILFDQIASNPKAPTVVQNSGHSDPGSGALRESTTTSYTWDAPQANSRILLMLSTSDLESAEVQALGTITVLDKNDAR